jgi:hypothetical protein
VPKTSKRKQNKEKSMKENEEIMGYEVKRTQEEEKEAD